MGIIAASAHSKPPDRCCRCSPALLLLLLLLPLGPLVVVAEGARQRIIVTIARAPPKNSILEMEAVRRDVVVWDRVVDFDVAAEGRTILPIVPTAELKAVDNIGCLGC